MNELKKLLVDLGRDAKLSAEYEQDPDAVMKARGLPDEARKAMKAQDVQAVSKLSGLNDCHLTNKTIKCHD
jgi:hypothetical protein